MFPKIASYGKIKIFPSIFIIVIITAISFYPVVNNGFTNWDDEGHVIKNPYIKALSIKELIDFRSPLHFANFIPLTELTYMFEYRFFKLNPAAYHTTNLILHLINSILVFVFIYLISSNTMISVVVSLLFGIHPMHVESVAWISERKDVLYTFFFMLSIIAYLFYCKNNIRKVFYLLSFFLYLLSLLSKPMAISLPFVLFLIDYIEKREWSHKIILEKLLFFIVTIPLFLITLSLQKSALSLGVNLIFPDNILFLCYRISFYFFKLFFPVHLSAFYPYPQNISEGLPLLYWLSFLIIIVFFFFVAIFYKNIKGKRESVFGIAFFFVTILPVMQIIPIGRTIVSDRYTYVPYVGLFFIISVGFHKILKNIETRGLLCKVLFTGMIIITVITLSYLTWNRCHVWKDSITLWSDVIEKYPKTTIAYNNRALAFVERNEHKRALEDYSKALTIDPDDYTTHANICSLFIKTGYFQNAYTYCKNAIKLRDDPYDALNGLGTVHFHLKEYEKAIVYYKMAIDAYPQFAQAYYNLCSTYLIVKEYGLAIDACSQAIAIKPDYVEAYNNIGNIFFYIDNYQRALQFYKKAVEIDPRYAPAHNNLSVTYHCIGLNELAAFHQKKALELGYKVHPEISRKIKKRDNGTTPR